MWRYARLIGGIIVVGTLVSHYADRGAPAGWFGGTPASTTTASAAPAETDHPGKLDAALRHGFEAIAGKTSYAAEVIRQTNGLPSPAIDGAAAVTVGFSPGNAESVVVHTIAGASKTIRVAAYSFTSKPIAQALVAAHRRGVDVMVVVDKSQRGERYTSATFLANMGIPLRVNARYAIMHNKFLVVDGRTVQTGSFNYTSSAARRNAENVIVIAGQPAVASTYDAEWQRLWAEAEPYAARY